MGTDDGSMEVGKKAKSKAAFLFYFFFFAHNIDGRAEYLRYLRGLVPLGLFLDQLSLGVDGEYPAERNAHLLIGKDILRGETKKKKKT